MTDRYDLPQQRGGLNAISAKVARELRQAVRFIADPARQIHCLVITGAGPGFSCALADGLIVVARSVSLLAAFRNVGVSATTACADPRNDR